MDFTASKESSVKVLLFLPQIWLLLIHCNSCAFKLLPSIKEQETPFKFKLTKWLDIHNRSLEILHATYLTDLKLQYAHFENQAQNQLTRLCPALHLNKKLQKMLVKQKLVNFSD